MCDAIRWLKCKLKPPKNWLRDIWPVLKTIKMPISFLKALDIVQATNMIAASWRETSSTIIQNCFCKAGFKHHAVDPAPETEDPLPAPVPDVWNRVQKWLGDVQFDEFAASEPEAATAQPMSDQDIVNIVLTENDAQDKSDDES